MKPTAVTQVIEAAVKVGCGLSGAFLVIWYAKSAFLAGRPVFLERFILLLKRWSREFFPMLLLRL